MITAHNDHQFSTYVEKNFDFLKSDFEFRNLPKALSYVKNGLEIEFFHGKGEVDIVLFVRRVDEKFRLYVSRSFYLLDIVGRLKKGKIEYPNDLPEYLIEMKDVDKYLEFCADLTKTYCKEILEGDLSLLEEIHMARRENA